MMNPHGAANTRTETMDDLVEKVCRSMSASDGISWELLDELEQSAYRVNAVAAIRAVLDGIREPTPAMIERAQRSTEMGGYVAAEWANAYDCFREFHYAMIDELRKLYD